MPAEHAPGPDDATPRPDAVQSLPAGLNQLSLDEATPTSPKNVAGFGLSGKERAGLWLTWGVLSIIVLFLGVAFAYLYFSEQPACKVLEVLREPISKALTEGKPLPETVTAVFQQCETQRKAFHEFWLEILQRILINTLLPVLTALLGYLFGTQAMASQE